MRGDVGELSDSVESRGESESMKEEAGTRRERKEGQRAVCRLDLL